MQLNRLFRIVYLLIEKKTMTAQALADCFEVSKRTILRDVETLSAAGVPIYTSQGKGGGISIMDNYVLNKALISEEEQNQIIFALQSLAVTQRLDGGDVLGKLQSLFEKTDTNWIKVDFSRWGNSQGDKAKFDTIKNAIIHKQAIAFCYSSSYGKTINRKVYPLRLVYKSNAWYLQAFCLLRQDYRIFKISRTQHITLLEESFASLMLKIPEIEPSELQTPCPLSVKILFPSTLAFRIYEEFDETAVTKNEDGSFTVTMEVPNDYWIYGYIMSFGDAVEVLAPESLRAGIAKMADSIKNKYVS